MKRDFVIDYFSYTILRLLGPLVRMLPLGLTFFIGKRLGDIFYIFDLRHRALAYANIKKALGDELSLRQISRITRNFYRSFGQNLMEIFLIPRVNKEYMDKFVTIEGRQYIDQGFKKGKGVILLGMHAGSWELSNMISAYLAFPFNLFVRQQRLPFLNKFLNSYRRKKGCKLIERQNQNKQLLQVLRNNEAIGMTADQGGKRGTLVKFFAKSASIPSGAVKLALKYDSTLIPAFYARINGPYLKVIIEKPFQLIKSGNDEEDIRNNLQELMHTYENNIRKYPHEYLWTYKIWKYGRDMKILILDDKITGHLRQSQAVGKITEELVENRGFKADIQTIKIDYKNKFSCLAFNLGSCFSGKYRCQGCLLCLRNVLSKDSYQALIKAKPDIVISCGNIAAMINFLISQENLAKSILIMRPSIVSTNRFKLAIIPEHDRPKKKANVIVTKAALNLVDERYLEENKEKLIAKYPEDYFSSGLTIGFLIGGDSKKFKLESRIIINAVLRIKAAVEGLDGQILVTTSRRTSREVENRLKQQLESDKRCKVLIIANENNIPEAVGGILALSDIVITTPESISMISEAVSSKKYVVVIQMPGLSNKHASFIDNLLKNKLIYFSKPEDLEKTIGEIQRNKPKIEALDDKALVREAIAHIL